ncbi:MAG: hypothetical protein DRI86_11770 [Bacteroidetes bacterium]|nr:MAG: hypothetical protein DRI86_11770 [Bacteroidota bacterium]
MGTIIKHSKTYFILGLLIGLGVGIIFGLYTKNKESITELSSVIFNYADSSLNSKNISQNMPKHIIEKAKPKKSKKKKRKKKIVLQDSLHKDSITILNDSINSKDTLLIDTCSSLQNDSLACDTLIDYNIDSISINDTITLFQEEDDTTTYKDDEMIIAQDELIYSEYITPQGKKSDFLCSTDGKLDSILTNNIVTRNQEGLFVEFWRSPLNSTGYKLTHNTLILYGFYQYKAVSLKYLKTGRLRIQYLSESFEITCSDKFVPLQISK